MPKGRTKDVPPLALPPGVRLVLVVDGREYAVRLHNRRAYTAAGECPRKAVPRRVKVGGDGGLFGDAGEGGGGLASVRTVPAAVIRVYAARGDLDKAYGVANHPDLRPYPTEVRTDPLTQGE